ncbi:hypothetical protein [Candidatus Nitrososphaera gargensis]|uniref:hypothetical protein n=1 Tax=Candidatus Nitrososphaera gargensis TaxID=497727 RepID=UPI00389940B6
MDTYARWGFSHTRGWIFGYKLHITSSNGSLIVPFSADFTPANVFDNQLYVPMASNLPPGVRYMQQAILDMTTTSCTSTAAMSSE